MLAVITIITIPLTSNTLLLFAVHQCVFLIYLHLFIARQYTIIDIGILSICLWRSGIIYDNGLTYVMTQKNYYVCNQKTVI